MGGGEVTGDCSVQVLPFQLQVSSRKPELSAPPKRTMPPVAGSEAIVAP